MRHVEIRDVSPRDGLQDIETMIPVELKAELVRRLWLAGMKAIEVTSFVSPKRVPQLADGSELCALVAEELPKDVVLSAFVANARGAERALEAGVAELSTTVPATDGISRANFGMDSDEMFTTVAGLTRYGSAADLSVTVAVAFGCPYDGRVSVASVRELAGRLADAGYARIYMGDTIGVADPASVRTLFEELAALDGVELGAHFHDARGAAVANVVAALDAGASLVDSALGGLGGCPFAPGAAGNVASEDLCWALEAMGYDIAPDARALVDAAHWLRETVGVELASRMPSASRFAWEPNVV
jgi:hydroxymethylglutaryl-CoA lyase